MKKVPTEERPLVYMDHICRDYPMGGETLHVLKDVHLEVSGGEFLAVLGPSGSGKSTLMNIIGCLDEPTSGEYYLNGKYIPDADENELSDIRGREIGFVFQNFCLLQKQTAYENTELPLLYAGVPEQERKERVEEVLELVGMADRSGHYPSQLSGGQQQRIAIARALVNHPSIVLADEPTGALDQKTGAQVMELFEKLNENGNTIIMITHDAKTAGRAKRMVRILDGVIGKGTAEDA